MMIKAKNSSVAKSPISQVMVGLVLSVALTVASYGLAQVHIGSGHEVPADKVTIFFIFALAITQLFAQLSYFLHLGTEAKPRIRRITFAFAFMVVLILVTGSLWIMQNLNRNMGLKNKYSDEFIIKDEIPEK